MKYQKDKKAFRYTILFLSWLCFSPLLLIFGKKWGVGMPERLIFALCSPFTVIVALFLFANAYAWLWVEAENQKEKHAYSQFTTKPQIEQVVGMNFPNYIETDRKMPRPMHITGDYRMEVRMKFTEDNDLETFYREVEDKGWQKYGDKYSYSFFNDTTLTSFSISVNKQDSTVLMRYGKQ